MTPGSYRVLTGPVSAEIEVRRSRFLCLLHRRADEQSARDAVAAARRTHPGARHHCSAIRLGAGVVERSSDDGEPAGTGGAPMLEVLRGADVGDVVAVVARWFGGTLLGAGGLVRAYGDAVRAGLDAATLVERQRRVLASVTVGHGEAARLENDLRARGVPIRGTEYAVRATLTLAVTAEQVASVAELVAGLTAGARLEPVGESWVDLDR